ncbi:MAG: response regulator transcription factor [Bacteroidota bacterium]
MGKRILVVDDERNVRHMLDEYLRGHGYDVQTATNGREALIAARQFFPDLVLLDVMMPEMDGLEFVRHFRQESNTPVIFLTARIEETEKVVGLELGGDDYVTKPFGMRELLARVKAVLRRTSNAVVEQERFAVGDVVLDKSRRRVEVSGAEIRLTPTEFMLLAVLIAHPGRVYSRAQLLERLHDIAVEGVERTVDVHIRNLRAKIEPDAGTPRYVETVFGAGYRFAEPTS